MKKFSAFLAVVVLLTISVNIAGAKQNDTQKAEATEDLCYAESDYRQADFSCGAWVGSHGGNNATAPCRKHVDRLERDLIRLVKRYDSRYGDGAAASAIRTQCR